MSSNTVTRRGFLRMAAFGVGAAFLAGCAQPTPEAKPAPTQVKATVAPAKTPAAAEPKGILVVQELSVPQYQRNFNPFLQQPPSIWAARSCLYEPMMIYSSTKSEFVPWLATEYQWNADATKLTFKTRTGVKWSDGKPFGAKDVVFTFEMLKKFPALDTGGIWKKVNAVKLVDENTVEFSFPQAMVPALLQLAQVYIVPEHIWKDVPDPVMFTNENPVGTGPFTEVAVFQPQVYEMRRNPNYWQPGKPYILGVRQPTFTTESHLLALGNGEIDWGGAFVPDIQTTFASKDPANFKWWAPATGNSTFLYLNTTRKPFDNINVRKAISMSIDRQQLCKVALYGYSSPDDATGLSASHNRWKDPQIVQKYADLVTLNTAKANQMLDEAGLKKGSDGKRRLPDGSAWKVYVDNAGWADYAAVSQFAAQGMQQLGIDAEARAFAPEAWFDKVYKADFDASVGWSTTGSTPYETYRHIMSSETWAAAGEKATANWHRYKSAKADDLLKQLATAAEFEKQKEIVYKLEQVYVDEFPCVPLYSQGTLAQLNYRRFTGFPNADDPYCNPTTIPPQAILTLTKIKPK